MRSRCKFYQQRQREAWEQSAGIVCESLTLMMASMMLHQTSTSYVGKPYPTHGVSSAVKPVFKENLRTLIIATCVPQSIHIFTCCKPLMANSLSHCFLNASEAKLRPQCKIMRVSCLGSMVCSSNAILLISTVMRSGVLVLGR